MGAIALQWHTRVKFLTDVPLSYLTGAFVLDAKAFSRLTPEDQRIVRETVREAAQRLDADSRVGEASALKARQGQGIEFVTAANEAELERWHDITREALVVLRRKQIYTEATIDEMLGHLQEFRAANPGGS